MFEVFLEQRAWRDLSVLPSLQQKQFLGKINQFLSVNPFPRGKNPKRLKGEKAYRLRMGNYRVLYTVAGKQVFVYAIGHRKDVYR